jgi:hypothetical protein
MSDINTQDIEVGREIKINQQPLDVAITPEVMAFYALRATNMKTKIDRLGAETSQRQDKMRLINDLIASINNLTDEKNGLDITKHPDLLSKLQVAKDLGVEINLDKLKLDSVGRDRLVENLHRKGDNWDKENKNQTQQMEIYVKELDRIMMLLKEVQKNENQAKRGATAGIKGG